jgi:hypothetical protein
MGFCRVFGFFFCVFFLEHNGRPDLTSPCYPQVKLKGREPAGLSLAHYWVATQKLPIEGPRPQQGYSSETSPMGSGFGVFTMIRASSAGGNFALQAVNDKVKRNGAKGSQEENILVFIFGIFCDLLHFLEKIQHF